MKALFAALLLLGPVLGPAAAQTTSPEQSYLAARDAAIKSINAMDTANEPEERIAKREEEALLDLGKRLRALIGAPQLKGVTDTGKINNDTLRSGDVGFGALDGVAYESKDEKTRIVATTETLTSGWLLAHKNWWPDLENVPQDIPAALKSETFYTQAISADAAVAIFTELLVTKPAAAKAATALLVVRRQDIGPSVPDEIIVSAALGGRVYVASLRVEGKAAPIAACTQIWDKSQKEAEVIFEAYRATEQKDEKLFDSYTKKQEEGDTAFRKCFGERAKTQPYFPDLTKAAQALLDGLPEK
ncbi:MAG: hypothetical protein JWN71_2346 [Xanthobacteraceae bacterium]|nr:hypothetical protein [Xanthobacteraceae bacterium]